MLLVVIQASITRSRSNCREWGRLICLIVTTADPATWTGSQELGTGDGSRLDTKRLASKEAVDLVNLTLDLQEFGLT